MKKHFGIINILYKSIITPTIIYLILDLDINLIIGK